MLFVFTSLILLNLNSVDEETPIVMEFPEYSCKLTLPSPQFKWIEQEIPPDSLAGFYDDIGTKLLFTAKKIPAGVVLNESLIKEIQSPFNQQDSISIQSGEMITFRKVPCYQFHIRFKENSSVRIIRIFIANGYLYELQLMDSSLLIKNRNLSEYVFSAFEFMETPDIPIPNSDSTEKKPYNIVRILVRVIFFTILVISVLFAVAKSANKK
ncbi:hypothetical protein [Gimesia aquarii]|uniref:Uncharacterized protein n=1 Tax=Gimesia aquarii TaxID=2527964 RepID=A0A517WXG5_9PLAN|nr:hypothetical protein [Gimesia aquarii]QDU09950.1 hypothetical protein V202x_33470 [Gimesia aquarii]